MIRQIIGYVKSWFWKKESISGITVRDAIKRDLSPTQVYMADNKYVSYSLKRIKWLLSLDKTDQRIYVPELYDCDDYAATLYGRMKERHGNATFGMAWVFWKKENGKHAGHAVNVYYCHEYDITYIIEPQNDNIFMKPENWKVLFVIM